MFGRFAWVIDSMFGKFNGKTMKRAFMHTRKKSFYYLPGK